MQVAMVVECKSKCFPSLPIQKLPYVRTPRWKVSLFSSLDSERLHRNTKCRSLGHILLFTGVSRSEICLCFVLHQMTRANHHHQPVRLGQVEMTDNMINLDFSSLKVPLSCQRALSHELIRISIPSTVSDLQKEAASCTTTTMMDPKSRPRP